MEQNIKNYGFNMNDKEQLEKLSNHLITDMHNNDFRPIPNPIWQGPHHPIPVIGPISEDYEKVKEIWKTISKGKDGQTVKDPNTTTVRNDGGKNRVDLLPVGALNQIAKVLTAGASKYGDSNWRPGMAWSRCYGSCLRHLFAWWRGENLDPETGLSHLAHAACNILFLLEYQEKKKGTDDRYIG